MTSLTGGFKKVSGGFLLFVCFMVAVSVITLAFIADKRLTEDRPQDVAGPNMGRSANEISDFKYRFKSVEPGDLIVYEKKGEHQKVFAAIGRTDCSIFYETACLLDVVSLETKKKQLLILNDSHRYYKYVGDIKFIPSEKKNEFLESLRKNNG
jgi:hypothetical protein